jgi:hypothetical protein
MNIKTITTLLFIAACVLLAADPKPATPLDELGKTKLQVLSLQQQIRELQSQKAACEYQLAQTGKTDADKQAQEIIRQAAERLKLDPDKVQLDPQTLTFVEKPKPADAPVPPKSNTNK